MGARSVTEFYGKICKGEEDQDLNTTSRHEHYNDSIESSDLSQRSDAGDADEFDMDSLQKEQGGIHVITGKEQAQGIKSGNPLDRIDSNIDTMWYSTRDLTLRSDVAVRGDESANDEDVL